MADAAITADQAALQQRFAALLADCRQALARSGQSLVTELLRDHGEFRQWDHVPAGDVRDPGTGALFYYHAHSPDQHLPGEHGHLHNFVTVQGADGPAVIHLGAISLDSRGEPFRLFMVNRWVTDEAWRPAATTAALIENFVVDVVRPNWVVSRYVTALVQFYRQRLVHLLAERDRALGVEADGALPDPGVLENRARMVLAQARIDLAGDLDAVLTPPGESGSR